MSAPSTGRRDRERFTLTVEPIGGGWKSIAGEVRLRRWIKAARRAYGLAVVEIRREPTGDREVQP